MEIGSKALRTMSAGLQTLFYVYLAFPLVYLEFQSLHRFYQYKNNILPLKPHKGLPPLERANLVLFYFVRLFLRGKLMTLRVWKQIVLKPSNLNTLKY